MPLILRPELSSRRVDARSDVLLYNSQCLGFLDYASAAILSLIFAVASSRWVLGWACWVLPCLINNSDPDLTDEALQPVDAFSVSSEPDCGGNGCCSGSRSHGQASGSVTNP